MRTLVELLRIILIVGLLGGFCWAIIGNIYTIYKAAETYSWLGALSILVLLFVLYRNKFQFSGWYKGKSRNKLPKNITLLLIFASIILGISPFVLGSILN